MDAFVLLSADVEVERIPGPEFLSNLLLDAPIDRGVPGPLPSEDKIEERVAEVVDLQATVGTNRRTTK